MTYKNLISLSKKIDVSKERLWEFISSPGNLKKCHPFCKKNNIIQWDKNDHYDSLEYLNGLVYFRKFIIWKEGKGYTLLIGEKNKKKSKVVWEINSRNNKTYLTISIYPYFMDNYSKILSYLPYKFIVKPKLKTYLNSVIMGINYYLVKNKTVEKNMFGKHEWFS